MGRLIAIVGLALCVLALDGSAKPPAQCAFCSTAPCVNSTTCLRGCTCLKRGLDTMGECVSLDALP